MSRCLEVITSLFVQEPLTSQGGHVHAITRDPSNANFRDGEFRRDVWQTHLSNAVAGSIENDAVRKHTLQLATSYSWGLLH